MFDHAQLIRPCHGERVSGDAIVTREFDDALLVAIVDVLGHGREANELALRIEAFLDRAPHQSVATLMTRLHTQFRGSRGAAIGLGIFHLSARRLDYVGVGNTVVRRFGTTETRLVSHDGVVGQNMRTPRVQTLTVNPGELVVFYTDGIRDRFSTAGYPGLFHHPPQQVVRTLVDRFGKNHDDAGCIAVRCPSA